MSYTRFVEYPVFIPAVGIFFIVLKLRSSLKAADHMANQNSQALLLHRTQQGLMNLRVKILPLCQVRVFPYSRSISYPRLGSEG